MKTAVKNRKTVGLKTKPKSQRKPRVKPIVSIFREFKKAIFGKSQKQSVDLLDQWILKKRALSLFL
jgi:hypothetical protein